MKKSITISIILLLLCSATFGQENRISVSAGYPFNLTNHWLVGKWEKPISFDLLFNHVEKYLIIGGGIDYSKNDISWYRYYDSDNNTISCLTPYLQVGLNLDKKITSLKPYLDLGYSALTTDVEIYNGDKGGFYSAVGLDYNFNLTNKFQLGFGANYAIKMLKLDFKYEGTITTDFIPTHDNTMKSISLNLNLVYRL